MVVLGCPLFFLFTLANFVMAILAYPFAELKVGPRAGRDRAAVGAG